jgi:hypothetical protein
MPRSARISQTGIPLSEADADRQGRVANVIYDMQGVNIGLLCINGSQMQTVLPVKWRENGQYRYLLTKLYNVSLAQALR